MKEICPLYEISLQLSPSLPNPSLLSFLRPSIPPIAMQGLAVLLSLLFFASCSLHHVAATTVNPPFLDQVCPSPFHNCAVFNNVAFLELLLRL